MRKVYVNLTVRLVLDIEEGIGTADVIDELDYKFTSTTDGALVADTEIKDWDVQQPK